MKFLLVALLLVASASAQNVFQCEDASGVLSGQIQSRGYPNEYPEDEVCESQISVTPGSVLSFTFEVLDTESTYDEVVLHDGPDASASVLGRFSGTSTPTNTFRASTHQMFVSFTSDFSIGGTGFSAFFQESEPLPQFQCTEVTGVDVGEIVSRNFPNNYPVNDVCESHIMVDAGVVTLQFDLLNTETTDIITLHDGPDATGDVIATVSGTTVPPTRFVSTGPSMFVSFRDDGSGVRRGFRAVFEKTIPLERFTCEDVTGLEGAELASPNWPGNYANNADCGSHVTVAEGSIVTFKFDELNVEPNVDFVTLYDGADATATQIARVSATQAPGTTYRSTSNHMFVHFTSDSSGVRKGFLGVVRQA